MTISAAPDNEFQWFTTHLGHYSLTVIAVLSVFLVVTRVIEGSEKIAKYVPLVGRLLRARGVKREEKRRELIRAEVEQVTSELEPPGYREKVEDFESRIKALEQKDRMSSEYLVYDAAWHFEDRMERAAKGSPLKQHMNYPDFADKWLTGMRYDNGEWHKA